MTLSAKLEVGNWTKQVAIKYTVSRKLQDANDGNEKKAQEC